MTKLSIVLKGGPGSGHHGHRGRVGKRGGSVPDTAVGSFVPGSGEDVGIGNFEFDDASFWPINNATLRYSDYARNYAIPSDIPNHPYKLDPTTFSQSAARREMKDNIVSVLSERTGIEYEKVNEFIKQWSYTSNKGYESISIQEAFAEEFGVELSDWQKDIIEPYNKEIKAFEDSRPFANEAYKLYSKYLELAYENDTEGKFNIEKYAKMDAAAEWKNKYPHGPAFEDAYIANSPHQSLLPKSDMKKLARAMYDLTQERLADAPDTLILFRGLVVDDFEGAQPGDVALYEGNAIESWTASRTTARSFAYTGEGSAAVVAMSVPKKNIIGSCFSGFGCLNEQEYIVLGSIPGQTVRIKGIQ